MELILCNDFVSFPRYFNQDCVAHATHTLTTCISTCPSAFKQWGLRAETQAAAFPSWKAPRQKGATELPVSAPQKGAQGHVGLQGSWTLVCGRHTNS